MSDDFNQDAELLEKFEKLSDRKLIMFSIFELIRLKRLICEHIEQDKTRQEQRWRLYTALGVSLIGSATALIIALL